MLKTKVDTPASKSTSCPFDAALVFDRRSEVSRRNKWLCRRLVAVVLGTVVLFSSALAVRAEDNGTGINAVLREGWRLYGDNKFEAARREFQRALSLERNCPDAWNGIGLCYKNEGNMGESDRSYAEALKLNPDHYESLYNLANNRYLAEDYADAINYFTQAKNAAGDRANTDLYLSLANVFRDKSRGEKGVAKESDSNRALTWYQKVLQMEPNMPNAHGNLGHLYKDMGDMAAAERELRTAVALRKEYPYALYQLGLVQMTQHKYPDALVALRTSHRYENVAGYKVQTLKDITEQLGVPKEVYQELALGYEYLATPPKLEDAESEFEAAAGHPGKMQAVAWNNVGYTRLREGKLSLAFEAFNAALKLSVHGVPQVYYNLGQAYMKEGKKAEAEKAFAQAITEAQGRYPLAHNALGILLKSRHKYEDALSRYKVAIMQSGDSLPVVHYNRAVLYEAMNNKRDALDSYKRYLQQSPYGTNADAAKKRIATLSENTISK